MGTTERKEREKLEMKETILNAATEMFLNEGFEKTSVRAIANKIEYSVGTIYLYFKDKTELLNALMEQGFQKLGKDFSKVEFGKDPVENLKKLGQAYVKFAMHNQEYYDLMFIMKRPIEIAGQEWVSGNKTLNMLKSTVASCIKADRLITDDEDAGTLASWGIVHGLSALYSSNRLRMFDQSTIENDIYKAINLFVDSLSK